MTHYFTPYQRPCVLVYTLASAETARHDLNRTSHDCLRQSLIKRSPCVVITILGTTYAAFVSGPRLNRSRQLVAMEPVGSGHGNGFEEIRESHFVWSDADEPITRY